ncbi:MAG: HAMP domain-containing histidine kinase [Lachnospiraceae bacterium]|nr:HAMP domain-containing histidine kinase [Lachnospiraceae bacterium]
MKLKTRLVVSFLIITIVPLLLSALLGAAVIVPQLFVLGRSYGVSPTDIGEYMNTSFALINKANNMAGDYVKEEILTDPEKLRDAETLAHINEELKNKNSYIVVRGGGEYLYIGTNLTDIDVINRAVVGTLDGYEFLRQYGQIYSVLHTDEPDGAALDIYIFTETGDILPEFRSVIFSIVAMEVVILIITASILVYWLYSSIIRPIGALRVAARNIRDGHLDFDIEKPDDEMGELASDFDEMRRRLSESAKEKVANDEESRQLISNISHDLKTPLTAVRGYVEGLRDGLADTPEKQAKYIHIISQKVDDMTRLIDELSLYSKIDNNRIPYNFREISVKDYMADCAVDIGGELEEKGIEFCYYDYLKTDSKVLIDSEQFGRVLTNIISNSVKYMDKPKGRINIRLSDTDDTVIIEEEDNGMGIADEDLPNIFDRFYRADASRASTGGSGIGLAIVKKIVEDHGGTVSATSRKGTGTIMRIELKKIIKEKTEV